MRQESSVRDYLKVMVSDLPKKGKYSRLINIYQSTGSESLRSCIRTEIGEMLTGSLYRKVLGLGRKTLESYNISPDEPVGMALKKILEKLDYIKDSSSIEEYSFEIAKESIYNVLGSLYPVSLRPEGASNKQDLERLKSITYKGRHKELIINNGHVSKF
jgi:hypothetical protein